VSRPRTKPRYDDFTPDDNRFHPRVESYEKVSRSAIRVPRPDKRKLVATSIAEALAVKQSTPKRMPWRRSREDAETPEAGAEQVLDAASRFAARFPEELQQQYPDIIDTYRDGLDDPERRPQAWARHNERDLRVARVRWLIAAVLGFVLRRDGSP
jgi:hypothetical protein